MEFKICKTCGSKYKPSHEVTLKLTKRHLALTNKHHCQKYDN